MTDDEFREHIAALQSRGTDHRHVEAKRSQSGIPKRLWETLSAFSNSPGGGVVILGLDEARGFRVVGVDDPGRIQTHLQSMCSELEPRVAALIDIKEIEGKHLVIAEVPEILPGQKPCFHRASGMTNGAFVRQGDADRRLGPYEVQVLLSARGQPTYDREAVAEATIVDLDERAVAAFLSRVRERRPRLRERTHEEILRTLKVVVPHPEGHATYVPSIAGLLIFGREPQQFFPQLAVLFSAFPGRSIGELGPNGERLIDDARIEGNIAQMVAETITRIVGNMRHARREAGVMRTTDPELPRAALSEALVNALAHRDLYPDARGTAVQVHLFADRLTIVNPGGLYGPTTVDTLGTGGLTSARNAVLMQLLEDAVSPGTGEAIAEHRGTGIPAMIEALRAAAMSPPRFDDTIATFRVIFPRESLINKETLAWLAALGPRAADLTRDQRMALALMRAGETVTNARYRQVSGVDSRVATRELGDLASRDLIQMTGAGRWAEYTLADALVSAAPATGPLLRGDRRPDIRDLLRKRGPLTRAELQNQLGVHQTTVSRWLRVMRLDKEIEQITATVKDPRARYRLVDSD